MKASVFTRPPLNSLPRFADLESYFRSRTDRRDGRLVECGVWNTGTEIPTEEVVTLYLATTAEELIAVRNPLGTGPRLPVVVLSRGISKETIDTAAERAKDRAQVESPDNVNNLDWLLAWPDVGRGCSPPRRGRRRPRVDHPHQLLYG